MSCRTRRVQSIDEVAIQALTESAPYMDLARLDRREDFDWLAQSQGVPPENIEELWQALRARATGAPGPKR